MVGTSILVDFSTLGRTYIDDRELNHSMIRAVMGVIVVLR